MVNLSVECLRDHSTYTSTRAIHKRGSFLEVLLEIAIHVPLWIAVHGIPRHSSIFVELVSICSKKAGRWEESNRIEWLY